MSPRKRLKSAIETLFKPLTTMIPHDSDRSDQTNVPGSGDRPDTCSSPGPITNSSDFNQMNQSNESDSDGEHVGRYTIVDGRTTRLSLVSLFPRARERPRNDKNGSPYSNSPKLKSKPNSTVSSPSRLSPIIPRNITVRRQTRQRRTRSAHNNRKPDRPRANEFPKLTNSPSRSPTTASPIRTRNVPIGNTTSFENDVGKTQKSFCRRHRISNKNLNSKQFQSAGDDEKEVGANVRTQVDVNDFHRIDLTNIDVDLEAGRDEVTVGKDERHNDETKIGVDAIFSPLEENINSCTRPKNIICDKDGDGAELDIEARAFGRIQKKSSEKRKGFHWASFGDGLSPDGNDNTPLHQLHDEDQQLESKHLLPPPPNAKFVAVSHDSSCRRPKPRTPFSNPSSIASNHDNFKRHRLSNRARTRLTMREINTHIQPGRSCSTFDGISSSFSSKNLFEKHLGFTVPKTLDFFKRIDFRLVLINTVLSVTATALVLYVFPRTWQKNLRENYQAIQVLGAFLSFALVFRTQTCYYRWWEARTQWGRMTSASVNLAGQALAMLGGHHHDDDGKDKDDYEYAKEQEDLVDKFLAHCIVFPYACKAVLRGNLLNDASEEGPRFLHCGMLTDADLGVIIRHGRPPFVCIEILRRIIYEFFRKQQRIYHHQRGIVPSDCFSSLDRIKYGMPPSMHNGALLAMEEQLNELSQNFGACLKINNTKMPSSYTLFMKSYIIFYFLLTSLSWAPSMKWSTPIITGIMVMLLNTVIVIGDQMMRPFDLQWAGLPLKKYCVIIEHEIMNVSRRHADIESLFR